MRILSGNTKNHPLARIFRHVGISVVIVLVGLASIVGSSIAQTPVFDSRSTGVDGPLDLTGSQFAGRTLDFAADSSEIFGGNPVDADNDNIFHFTTVDIPASVTLTMSGQGIDGSVYWLATGNVNIGGTVDVSGEDGYPSGITSIADRRPSVPGPGGFHGGVGGFNTQAGFLKAQDGMGPGRGTNALAFAVNGSSAGYGTRGHNWFNPSFGILYGNDFLVPLIGGSGGSGAQINQDGAGGAGGGALLISSNTIINIDGDMLADGGDSLALPGHSGMAGAGSGGAIHLLAPVVNGSGGLSADGGDVVRDTTVIGSGGDGRIRIDTFQNNFSGTTSPTPTSGSPFMVLPTDTPVVRITKVGSANIQSNPSGDPQNPDGIINASTGVSVEIEAVNLPPGRIVQVIVYSETGLDQVVDSTPLSGTLASSTASANVILPFGMSRLMVQAVKSFEVAVVNTPTLTSARYVEISGNFAYVSDTNALRIFDISTPGNPSLVGSIGISFPYRVHVQGIYAFVPRGNAGMSIVNVSDPSNPFIESTIAGGTPLSVFVQGNYAYMASNGLTVLDISDVSAPLVVGSEPAAGSNGFDIVVANGYAYMMGSTLRIVDVSDPTNPRLVQTVPTRNNFQSMAIRGNYLYAAENNAGFRIFELTSPTTPVEVSSLWTSSSAFGIDVVGNYAFLATTQLGMQVYDITNPAIPKRIDIVDTPGIANDVVVAGNHAYVADQAGGLRVIKLQLQ